MSALRRKFTVEQKMQILRQASEQGIIKVLQQNKLSYSVFTRWKQQLQKEQQVMQQQPYDQTQRQIEELRMENTRLKKIVANLALEMEMMNEKTRLTN